MKGRAEGSESLEEIGKNILFGEKMLLLFQVIFVFKGSNKIRNSIQFIKNIVFWRNFLDV